MTDRRAAGGTLAMLRPSLRDLQWRRRRFIVAVIGAGVLFGLTLAMTGISAGFDTEANQTVQQLRVDQWVVGHGAVGPFLGSSPMGADRLEEVQHLPGVARAVPTVFTRKDIPVNGQPEDVNVFGAPAGDLGLPAVTSGRPPSVKGEIAVSTKLPGSRIGERIELAGHPFTIVGTVDDSTALAGVPNVFLTLPDAQLVAFAGVPVVSAIAVRGAVSSDLPHDLTVVSNPEARNDLLRALKQARSTIYLTAVLSWIVAALIIGSVIYLSIIERLRDFAVFKAIGVSTKSILGGLAFQATVLSLGAAFIGIAVGALLGPNLSLPVTITWETYLLLPVVAIVVGLLASLVGIRLAVSVDPAAAFGGP
jgi:putative ABC transport system permease protein